MLACAAGGHTLQPTAIVHEAYLKLAGADPDAWNDQEHFLAVAARALRHVLVDHYRAARRDKRGGGAPVYSLDTTVMNVGVVSVDPLEIDEALTRLAGEDRRAADVVELRFFGGMTADQIARRLNVSEPTVRRDWRFARAWLHAEFAGRDGASR